MHQRQKQQVAHLERRFVKEVLNLLPKDYHREIRHFFSRIARPREVLRDERPPLLEAEHRYANLERQFWDKAFTIALDLLPEDRSSIEEFIASGSRLTDEQARHALKKPLDRSSAITRRHEAFLRRAIVLHSGRAIFRGLRPQFRKLRQAFNEELAQINPRLVRGPGGIPTKDEFRQVRDSVPRALFTERGPVDLARRRFIKEALKVLPSRWRDKFWHVSGYFRLQYHLKPFRPYIADAEYKYLTETALALVQEQEDCPALFIDSHPVIDKACRSAYASKDWHFFARLDYTLSRISPALHTKVKAAKRPTGPWVRAFTNWTKSRFTNLEWFLINHWITAENEIGPLYPLSIKELHASCKAHGFGNLNEGAVEKVRQRLRLMTFRRGVLGAS